jgi:hypothetical protein
MSYTVYAGSLPVYGDRAIAKVRSLLAICCVLGSGPQSQRPHRDLEIRYQLLLVWNTDLVKPTSSKGNVTLPRSTRICIIIAQCCLRPWPPVVDSSLLSIASSG